MYGMLEKILPELRLRGLKIGGGIWVYRNSCNESNEYPNLKKPEV